MQSWRNITLNIKACQHFRHFPEISDRKTSIAQEKIDFNKNSSTSEKILKETVAKRNQFNYFGEKRAWESKWNHSENFAISALSRF